MLHVCTDRTKSITGIEYCVPKKRTHLRDNATMSDRNEETHHKNVTMV